MILSSLYSNDVSTGFNETLRQLLFFILWYILFSFISEDKDLFKYAGALILSGVIVALAIIFSFFTSDLSLFLMQSKGIIHEGGEFKNVAAAGGIFSVSIPITLSLILFWQSTNNRLKLFSYSIIFIQLVGLILTNSRSALLAVIASSTIIFFILKKNFFKKFLFITIFSLIVTCVIIPLSSQIFELYFRANRIFENTRYILWDMSIKIIFDQLLFGTGPGQFKNYMYNYLPVMLGSWEETQIAWIYKDAGLGESHNFFLFRFAELGIFGFLSALFLPFIFISLSIRALKENKENFRIYYLIVGIYAMGLSMFIRSLLESTGLVSHGWITRDLPFWICFAIIIYLNVTNKVRIQPPNENIKIS
jgi:hypothetical protein